MHLRDDLALPMELTLLIQSFLPLTALIAARGVCRTWRAVLPGAHIPPARRRLLEFYLQLVRSPAFLATRAAVLPRVRPFSRARLLARLPPHAPEEFYCWVLEWPARAALGQIWPGLAGREGQGSEAALHKDRGVSLLWRRDVHILNGIRVDYPAPGCMETVVYRPREAKAKMDGASGGGGGGSGDGGESAYACGLLLDDACVEGWQRSRVLVLCGKWGGVDLAGRVYQVDGVSCALDTPFADSWVGFLRQELRREEMWLYEHGLPPVVCN